MPQYRFKFHASNKADVKAAILANEEVAHAFVVACALVESLPNDPTKGISVIVTGTFEVPVGTAVCSVNAYLSNRT